MHEITHDLLHVNNYCVVYICKYAQHKKYIKPLYNRESANIKRHKFNCWINVKYSKNQ